MSDNSPNCWITCQNPSNHAVVPCWERQKFLIILKRTPGIERKAAQSDPGSRPIALERISANYPEEEWTQVCTDGSAIEATRDGGRWVLEEAHISVAAGRYATNFKADAMVLNTAATEILANLDKTTRKFSSLMLLQYLMPSKTQK